jgi:hypothetical protein
MLMMYVLSWLNLTVVSDPANRMPAHDTTQHGQLPAPNAPSTPAAATAVALLQIIC